MKRNLTFLVFVCLLAAFSADAQTPNNQKLIADLLDLPAPPAVIPAKENTAKERPEKFFSNKNIPSDDAPLEDLLDFWKNKSSEYLEFQYNPQPSKKSLERILETLKDNPGDIPQFINMLPAEPDVADLVKNFYQSQLQDNPQAYYNLESVKRWLKRNTDLFVNELIKAVEAVKVEDDRLMNQEDFESLAIVDWDRAKPFIDRFESDRGNAETFALAKYVLYHRALKEGNTSDIERYRAELKNSSKINLSRTNHVIWRWTRSFSAAILKVAQNGIFRF